MKKLSFLVVLIFLTNQFFVLCVYSQCGIPTKANEKSREEVKRETSQTGEELRSLPPLVLLKNEDYKGELVFRANVLDLWTDNSKAKDGKNTVEVTLAGELYEEPTKILGVSRKFSDKKTLEGLASSYFSSSKAGDIDWIQENFLDKEKDKIRSVYEKKNAIEASKSGAISIKDAYITGKAEYKDYVILFIEQRYGDGTKVREALACKETKNGWRLTSSLTDDETFDIVFAALSTGQVKEN